MSPVSVGGVRWRQLLGLHCGDGGVVVHGGVVWRSCCMVKCSGEVVVWRGVWSYGVWWCP